MDIEKGHVRGSGEREVEIVTDPHVAAMVSAVGGRVVFPEALVKWQARKMGKQHENGARKLFRHRCPRTTYWIYEFEDESPEELAWQATRVEPYVPHWSRSTCKPFMPGG